MPTEPISSLSASESGGVPSGGAPSGGLPSDDAPLDLAGEVAAGRRYDHSEKAGNRGDLVKHAALLAAAAHLVARQPGDRFVYAESHAGAARHTLQADGAWLSGIGAFGRRVGAGDTAAQRWPALNPYVRSALQRAPLAGLTYPGSHALLHRWLTAAGVLPQMHLWDTDSHVCSDLRLRYRAEATVTVSRSDGYSGLGMLPFVDLALVDPPDFEPRRVAQAIAGLSIKESPFLCWLPRVGTEVGEDPLIREFRELVAEDYFVGTAQWKEWQPGLCGCVLVASADLREPLAAVMTELLWAMGWRP